MDLNGDSQSLSDKVVRHSTPAGGKVGVKTFPPAGVSSRATWPAQTGEESFHLGGRLKW